MKARSRLSTLATAGVLATAMLFSTGGTASAGVGKMMGVYSSKAVCNGVRNAYVADYKSVTQCFNEAGWFFMYEPSSKRY